MLQIGKDGYIYTSKNNITYDLLEGVSIESDTTSDILFIVCSDDSYKGDNILVGCLWGASELAENLEKFDELISELVEKFEAEKFDLPPKNELVINTNQLSIDGLRQLRMLFYSVGELEKVKEINKVIKSRVDLRKRLS